MSDDLPDIRVISITLEAPDWKPRVEWGDDFDEFSVPTILRISAAMVEEEILGVFLMADGDEDDDDEEAE